MGDPLHPRNREGRNLAAEPGFRSRIGPTQGLKSTNRICFSVKGGGARDERNLERGDRKGSGLGRGGRGWRKDEGGFSRENRGAFRRHRPQGVAS